jgi:hypothetical protein
MADLLNSNIIDSQQDYKSCAGKHCSNLGTELVRIKYIDRIGLFCKSCAEDLSQHGLGAAIDGEM